MELLPQCSTSVDAFEAPMSIKQEPYENGITQPNAFSNYSYEKLCSESYPSDVSNVTVEDYKSGITIITIPPSDICSGKIEGNSTVNDTDSQLVEVSGVIDCKPEIIDNINGGNLPSGIRETTKEEDCTFCKYNHAIPSMEFSSISFLLGKHIGLDLLLTDSKAMLQLQIVKNEAYLTLQYNIHTTMY